MKKKIQDLKIVEKQFLNKNTFTLELLAPEKLPVIYPGQFAEVLIKNSKRTFLRRPLSVHRIDIKKNTLFFLIQVVGEGTKTLGCLEKGDTLNIIYPLGSYFSVDSESKVLLVGGGCGVAPLLFLGEYLSNKGITMDILIGGKSGSDIIEIEQYKKLGEVYSTTEDGSMGEKGLVTDHSMLSKTDFQYKRIYACGPEGMMKAVASYARKKGTDCEVSLENTMACGFGACLCCVVETTTGNRCVCTDGPVFNIKELKWQT